MKKRMLQTGICCMLICFLILPITTHAQEKKEQIPFDIERFLNVVERQNNPYLGLNISAIP